MKNGTLRSRAGTTNMLLREALGLMLILLVAGVDLRAQAPSSPEDGPTNQALLSQALEASSAENWKQAEELLTKLLQRKEAPAQAWYWRGRAKFCLGKVKESAIDFDQYYEKVPEIRSRQWERGIALYYAGRFQDGAKQFELYQTYHDSDVENATWKYLCEAQVIGPKEAQANILEIGPDRRVPMRRIYDLYAGKASVEDVFKTVEEAQLEAAAEKRALYYAHLYVGLWYESLGQEDRARPHLKRAGTDLPIDHYMGWVGRVHWKLLNDKSE
jgi:lipoprotein NlpI